MGLVAKSNKSCWYLDTAIHKEKTMLTCSFYSAFGYIQLIPHVYSLRIRYKIYNSVGLEEKNYLHYTGHILCSIFPMHCSYGEKNNG